MRIIESEGGPAYSHCPHALPFVKKGDFISILNCAWKKVFKNQQKKLNKVNNSFRITPKIFHSKMFMIQKMELVYLLLFTKNEFIKSKIDELEEQIIAGPWNCTGRGRTKKLAQHRAAANILLKIIEDGRHKEVI